MARTHGRAPRGRRLRAAVPHGHWKTTTFVAGLRTSGLIARFVLDGAINRAAFEVYVERVLAPELRPGDVVVMDNLSRHKGPRVRELIEARRRAPALSPALQPRLQPHREGLRQAESAPAQGRRAHRRGALDRHRPLPRRLHPDRVPQRLRRLRIRRHLSENRARAFPDLIESLGIPMRSGF
jgi:hypothetical protein